MRAAGGTARPAVRVLGAVMLDGPGGSVATRSSFLRTLLALLALHPRRPVGTSLLIDELWAEDLPQDAKAALQIQVTRLRKWLTSASIDGQALRNEHDGYVLDIDPDDVDLLAFLGAADAALSSAELPADERLVRCDAALDLFTGEPFGGCVLALRLEGERLRANERHLQLVERRCEALIDLKRFDDALDVLGEYLAVQRAREKLTALAMIALYRSGRQRDALAACAETRRFLVNEYGIEPGIELVRLETLVLEQSDELLPVELPRSPSTPRPLLVGRSEELAPLGRLLEPGTEGHVVVVDGEAGVGKTVLVAAAVHDARSAGAAVGVGTWDDDGAPLAAWDQALSQLGVGPSARPEGGVSIAATIRGALARLALDRPVVLALEDGHLADATSLGILRGLARLGLPSRVVLVVTARYPDAQPRHAWSSTHADLTALASVTRMHLTDLAEDSVAELVESKLALADADGVERLAALLWARSGGQPLYLSALLDTMAGFRDVAECERAAEAIPDRLLPLLDHQLAQLPVACRDTLEVLAVVGPSSATDLAALAGSTALELSRALRPALKLGLVCEDRDQFAMRHAIVGAAVLDATPGATKAQIHHARFELVQQAASDPFEVLRHAIGAQSLLQPGDVGRARLAAAQAAYSRGAHVETLIVLTDDQPELVGDDLVKFGLLRGLALAAVGRTDEADEELDAVTFAPDAPPELVVTAAVGHEPLGLRASGDTRRLARLERAYEATRGDRSARRLTVLRALVIEETLVHGTAQTLGAESELAESAELLGVETDVTSRARVRVMAVRDEVEAPVEAKKRLANAEAGLELASLGDDPVLRLDAMELLMSAALAAGQVERCEDLRWALVQEAVTVNRPRSIWASRLVEAALLLAGGHPSDADEAAERALVIGTELGIADAVGAYGVHLVTKGLASGDLASTAELIDLAVTTYPHIAAWAAAAAMAQSDCSNTAEANQHLDNFVRLRSEQTVNYFDRPGLCLAAAAARALGRKDVALMLADVLPHDSEAVVVVGVGAGVFGPVSLYTAMIHESLGDTAVARSHAEEAQLLARRLGWPTWENLSR